MWEMRFPSESEVMKSTHDEQSRERQCFFQEKEWLSGPPELLSVLNQLKDGPARRGQVSNQRQASGEPIQTL